jgi:hypothetical protein
VPMDEDDDADSALLPSPHSSATAPPSSASTGASSTHTRRNDHMRAPTSTDKDDTPSGSLLLPTRPPKKSGFSTDMCVSPPPSPRTASLLLTQVRRRGVSCRQCAVIGIHRVRRPGQQRASRRGKSAGAHASASHPSSCSLPPTALPVQQQRAGTGSQAALDAGGGAALCERPRARVRSYLVCLGLNSRHA